MTNRREGSVRRLIASLRSSIASSSAGDSAATNNGRRFSRRDSGCTLDSGGGDNGATDDANNIVARRVRIDSITTDMAVRAAEERRLSFRGTLPTSLIELHHAR
jgi:hypothetical protein